MREAVGVVSFILALLIVIVFHEFGHFITAKRFGIKVEEFFIGFGPRLYARQKGETTFGVKALLLGGYVKIAGMNPWQSIPESELPRTFAAKPHWQRAIVLSAGSFTHFVLAFVVLFVLFGFVGVLQPTTTLAQVQSKVEAPPGFSITDGEGASPAAEAGLKPDDKIVSIEGRFVSEWDEVREAIRLNAGRVIKVGVLRDGQRLDFEVKPVVATGKDAEGKQVTIGLVGIVSERERDTQPVQVAAWTAMKGTGFYIGQSFRVIGTVFSPEGLGRIISAFGEGGARGPESPIGLVGAGRAAGQAASAGAFEDVTFLLVGMTVIIGVFNLLPLPPLDGGYLLILLVEKIRGKKVDLRKLAPVMALVLGILIFIFLSLLYLDIVRPVSNPFQGP